MMLIFLLHINYLKILIESLIITIALLLPNLLLKHNANTHPSKHEKGGEQKDKKG